MEHYVFVTDDEGREYTIEQNRSFNAWDKSDQIMGINTCFSKKHYSGSYELKTVDGDSVTIVAEGHYQIFLRNENRWIDAYTDEYR